MPNREKLKISVLVPTYNRAALLDESLASLEQQTLARDAFEVIVIDDGSTDDTGAVCKRRLGTAESPRPRASASLLRPRGSCCSSTMTMWRMPICFGNMSTRIDAIRTNRPPCSVTRHGRHGCESPK